MLFHLRKPKAMYIRAPMRFEGALNVVAFETIWRKALSY